jgi:serine/threonine protein phosphatase 1
MFGVSSARKARLKPRVPDGVRVYAVTDIHGRADLLQQVFTMIDRDLLTSRPVRPLHVFLGDYIDRGPDSRETIDLLIDRARRYECIFLKGNHELMLLEVLGNPTALDDWRQYGGLQTLVSYGLQPALKPDGAEQAELIKELGRRIPDLHRRFFQQLQTSYTCGDFFFVHAGVRPGVPLDAQEEQDLCWIREEFLQSNDDFGKYVVHGHSPVATADIRPNRINIDTGAYATGVLSLLSIQGDHLLVI